MGTYLILHLVWWRALLLWRLLLLLLLNVRRP